MPVQKKELDKSVGLLSDHELEIVLSNYLDKSEWIVLPFMESNGLIVETTRRTETSRRAIINICNNAFILKEIPWYCSSRKFVEYEMALEEYLSKEGLVPPILKTKNGAPWFLLKSPVEKSYFFSQKFIFGKSWDKTPNSTKMAGSLLGVFHKKCKQAFNHKDLVNKGPKENTFDLSKDMINLAKQLTREKEYLLNKNEVYLFNEYARKSLLELLKRKNSAMEKGYFGIKQPVHGDYNPWNLVFPKKKSSSIKVIDFDNSCVDNPVHDIAEGLVHFSFINYKNQTTIYEKPPTGFDEALAKSFLSGYIKSNRKMFYKIKEYLPEAIASIVIELSALGLVCGDYQINDSKMLLETNLTAFDKAKYLVSNF